MFSGCKPTPAGYLLAGLRRKVLTSAFSQCLHQDKSPLMSLSDNLLCFLLNPVEKEKRSSSLIYRFKIRCESFLIKNSLKSVGG